MPSAPIKLVVGFPPGGTVDILVRLLSPNLSAQMNNASVIVENKPGANGNIACEFVAKSAPNGSTLLFNSSGVILSRALGEKLGYDLFSELVPVTLVSSTPLLLTVPTFSPLSRVDEFIAHLRKNANKLAYGSAGTGSMTHLGPVMFLYTNGLNALHVPYKGAAPVLLDTIAGRIQFAMQTLTASASLVKDGRLKALAITSLNRSAMFPDVPTLSEFMPGFEITSWNGAMVAAKTPAAVVNRLNSELRKALQDSALKARLAQEGTEVLSSSSEDYAAYLRSENARWTKTINAAGISAE